MKKKLMFIVFVIIITNFKIGFSQTCSVFNDIFISEKYLLSDYNSDVWSLVGTKSGNLSNACNDENDLRLFQKFNSAPNSDTWTITYLFEDDLWEVIGASSNITLSAPVQFGNGVMITTSFTNTPNIESCVEVILRPRSALKNADPSNAVFTIIVENSDQSSSYQYQIEVIGYYSLKSGVIMQIYEEIVGDVNISSFTTTTDNFLITENSNLNIDIDFQLSGNPSLVDIANKVFLFENNSSLTVKSDVGSFDVENLIFGTCDNNERYEGIFIEENAELISKNCNYSNANNALILLNNEAV